MAHRVSRQAEDDLDDIWLYVAKQSGSMEIASRLVDSITSRFVFLAGFPWAGRSRYEDLGAGIRSFPAGEYVIAYCVDGADVFVLRVTRGSRDLVRLLAQKVDYVDDH